MGGLDIMRQMDQVAEAIAACPVPEWGPWVIYLVKKLDIEPKTKTQTGHRLEGEEWIRSVRDEIDARLEYGGW